jgi:hypothetical protein
VPDHPEDPLGRLAALEGVPSAMAAARDSIDALLRDRGLRRSAPQLTGESLLRGAHASAVLEGSALTLEAVRRGWGDGATAGATAGAAAGPAAGAVRVSTALLGLVPVLAAAPLQSLARLHVLAAKGAVADELLGRPEHREGAERLTALSRLLVGDTAAPALVVAAVVHAEVVSAAAFVSCNAIVARAAERLVLVGRGVDPKSLLVPEAAHLALRDQYESNLHGYREGGTAGVRAWLLYAATAYSRAVEASPLRG